MRVRSRAVRGKPRVRDWRLHVGGGVDFEYGAVRRFSFLRPGRCGVAKHVPPGESIWSSLVVGRDAVCGGQIAGRRTSLSARQDGPCDSGTQIRPWRISERTLCAAAEVNPTGFRGILCDPSPGVAAAPQPRARIRFPSRESARWTLCAVGEVGLGLGASTSQLTLGRSPTRRGRGPRGTGLSTCPGRVVRVTLSARGK